MSKSLILTAVLSLLLVSSASSAEDSANIKPANVAGQFYAADPQALTEHLERLLSQAQVKPIDRPVRVIVVPHAGYIYSGSVAAFSFKAASENSYSTVIVIGPSHYVATNEVGVWARGGYKTPLGVLPIDEELADALIALDERILFRRDMFQKEHSVEVELPFVQHVFKGAKIVPVVMGHTGPALAAKMAKGLARIIGARDDVLIVISSDLSHYFTESTAKELDRAALKAIESFDAEEIIRNNNKTMAIDGMFPVLTGMYYAQQRQADDVKVLKYSHSGYVSGDYNRVVGYGAVVFYDGKSKLTQHPEDQFLDNRQKKKLLEISKKTLDYYLDTGQVYQIRSRDRKHLPDNHGVFVSLYNQKQLRGCIGHIVSEQPLADLVRDMTIAAASKDQRFEPVEPEEKDDINIEISVLSKPQRIKSSEEFVLGKHGVIMSKGPKRGVFLPQVADSTGWTKDKFLTVLAVQKAGLAPDAWRDPSVMLEIFTADVFDAQSLD